MYTHICCGLQVIWTSGRTNCLHTDMDAGVVEQIRTLLRSAPPMLPQQQPQPLDSANHANGTHVADGCNDMADATAPPVGRVTSWLSPTVHVVDAGGSNATWGCDSSSSSRGGTRTPHGGEAADVGGGCTGAGGGVIGGGGGEGWTLIPDSPSSSFQKWAGSLIAEAGVSVFADLPAWIAQ